MSESQWDLIVSQSTISLSLSSSTAILAHDLTRQPVHRGGFPGTARIVSHTHIAHHRIIIIVNRSHHACHFCLKPFLIVFSKCFLYLMLAWLVAGRDLEAPVEAAAPVEAVAAAPVAARRLEQGRPGALLGRAKAQLRRRAAELRVADRLVNPGLANRVSKDVFGVHGGELSRTSAASSFVANPDFFIKVRKSDQHRRLLQRGAVSFQRQVPIFM